VTSPTAAVRMVVSPLSGYLATRWMNGS